MPGIDANDPRQPFEQIADYYRREIRTGQLKPGDRIPPGREVAHLFGVSHGTATRAMELLREEGLIVAWTGRGIFVRDTPSDATPANVPPHRRRMSRLDRLEYELRELTRRVDELERERGRP